MIPTPSLFIIDWHKGKEKEEHFAKTMLRAGASGFASAGAKRENVGSNVKFLFYARKF